MKIQFSHSFNQSPRSQLRKTGKVTQTSMFRTNKKAFLYEIWTKFKFYLLKITYTYFDKIPFDRNFFKIKHACLLNFPEIRGTENSGLEYIFEKKKKVNNLKQIIS